MESQPIFEGGFEPVIEGGLKKCKKGYARSRSTGRCHKAGGFKCAYGLTYDRERKVCRFKRAGGRGLSPGSRILSPTAAQRRALGFTPGRKSPFVVAVAKSPRSGRLRMSPTTRYYVQYTPTNARNVVMAYTPRKTNVVKY